MDFQESVVETLKYLSLTESSLSRVWQHAENREQSFAILTAFRAEFDLEDNVRRNLSLAAQLRTLGYGYFYLDGFSVENQGKENEIRVREDSIFAVGPTGKDKYKKFEADIANLSKKYEQDWFLMKPVGDNKAYGHTSKGVVALGQFKPNEIAVAYSQLRGGQTFVFEGARSGISWGEKLIRSREH